MPPFTIEYYCPLQSQFWQPYREGVFLKTIVYFNDFPHARAVCNSLLWHYHSARVVDSQANIVYTV